MTVQLVASEDDEIRLLGIENFRKEGRGEVIRLLAGGKDGVATNSLGDGEVQVGNLEDTELPVSGKMQRRRARRT